MEELTLRVKCIISILSRFFPLSPQQRRGQGMSSPIESCL